MVLTIAAVSSLVQLNSAPIPHRPPQHKPRYSKQAKPHKQVRHCVTSEVPPSFYRSGKLSSGDRVRSSGNILRSTSDSTQHVMGRMCEPTALKLARFLGVSSPNLHTNILNSMQKKTKQKKVRHQRWPRVGTYILFCRVVYNFGHCITLYIYI